MIRQHETLRVPQGWTEQDKALVIQLTRVFDDIYKQYGHLEWDDLGEKLREYLTEMSEGMVTAVTWDGTNKKLTVTINSSTSDVVAISTIKTALELTKSDVGLGNVDNKSVATIKTEFGEVFAAKSTAVTDVAYDSTNKKITKTVNGNTTDVVSVATIKTDLGLTKADVGLDNVENKSVAEIKSALGSFTWGALAGRS